MGVVTGTHDNKGIRNTVGDIIIQFSEHILFVVVKKKGGVPRKEKK